MDSSWQCGCCHQEKKAKTSEEADELQDDDAELDDSCRDEDSLLEAEYAAGAART